MTLRPLALAALVGLLLGLGLAAWWWRRETAKWDRDVARERTAAAVRDSVRARESARLQHLADSLAALPRDTVIVRRPLPPLPPDTAGTVAWREAAERAYARVDSLEADVVTLKGVLALERRTVDATRAALQHQIEVAAGLRAERDSAYALISRAPVARACRVPLVGIPCPVLVVGAVSTPADPTPRVGVAVGIPVKL